MRDEEKAEDDDERMKSLSASEGGREDGRASTVEGVCE